MEKLECLATVQRQILLMSGMILDTGYWILIGI